MAVHESVRNAMPLPAEWSPDVGALPDEVIGGAVPTIVAAVKVN